MRKNTNIGSMLFGILIGIFFTSLTVFMLSTSNITLKIPGTKTIVEPMALVTPEPTPLQQKEPRFDFYTELTKNIEPVSINSPNQNDTDLKSATKPINGYLLQIGLFKKNSSADGLKAKLTLDGFNTKIERIKLLDGEIRYRLTLGPYKTENQAKILQQRLKALEIECLLVPQYEA